MSFKRGDPILIYGFTVLQKLGSGSFGEIYKVQRKADGAQFALKVEK